MISLVAKSEKVSRSQNRLKTAAVETLGETALAGFTWSSKQTGTLGTNCCPKQLARYEVCNSLVARTQPIPMRTTEAGKFGHTAHLCVTLADESEDAAYNGCDVSL